MSTGLVPIDVAISTPTEGQFVSDAGQSLSINYNPAFQSGAGTLSFTPAGSASAGTTQTQIPTAETPSSAVATPGTASSFIPGTSIPATPGVAIPGSTLPQLSGSTLLLLIIGAALFLILGDSGGGGRHR